MPVTRILVLAALMAGLSEQMARAELMLTLGTFSSDPSSSGSASSSSNSAPTNTGGGFTLGLATSSGTASGATTAGTTSTNLAASNTTSQANNIVGFQSNTVAAPSASPMAASTPSTPTYDGFINLGAGPYANAGNLTTGNALPWYDSRSVIALFGGQISASQQAAFDSTVLQRVEQTFRLSGVPVTLTDNPNASAAHTLSVVSNAVNPSMGSAIGMTNLGGNGFHFIDNSAPAAQSVDQLEWIVAHNVAHELMLAFGVPEDHDQTGKYIDSTAGQLAMFLNPNSTFSTGAVQDLLSRNFLATGGVGLSASPQTIAGASVPEPATVAIWGMGAVVVALARRGRISISRRTV